MKADVLIVGGGPAGIVTGLTVRKSNPSKKVVLLRKEKQVLIPCGIPYILSTLEKVEDDIIPDNLLKDNEIELIVDEVTSINKEEKTVSTAGGKKITYSKLVLATGSNPLKPPIKGIDLDGVYFIKKETQYIKSLKSRLDESEDVVVVGGGFIGVEIADEISKSGKQVTLVEGLPHLLQGAFDKEFCVQAEDKLKEAGVKVLVNTRVNEFIGEGIVERVKLSGESDKELKMDAVIVCVGTKPNIKLAKDAGLKIGSREGIVVDEYMRTSEPDILAVGDCTEDRDFFTREVSSVMIASTATSEARVAAENIFQLKVIKQNKGTIGIFSTSVGGLVLATVGLTESKARERRFDYLVGEASAMDKHPGCLPGAHKLRVKLLFSRDSGVLLGGQVAGGVSAGELINMIGLAVQKSMTIAELNTLQIGTHPLLTPAPTVYPFILAAEDALTKIEEELKHKER